MKTAMRHSTPTSEPQMERLATPSAGEEVERRWSNWNPYVCVLGGCEMVTALENSLGVSYRVKHTPLIS